EPDLDGDDEGEAGAQGPERPVGAQVGDAADVDAEQAAYEAEGEEDGGDDREDVEPLVGGFADLGLQLFLGDRGAVARGVELLDRAGHAVGGLDDAAARG